MIRCVSPYRSSLGAYAPGQTVDNAALEAALVVDSPGSFELVEAVITPAPGAADPEPDTKAVEAPPEHRAVKASNTKRR
jgi:hypothetical protein